MLHSSKIGVIIGGGLGCEPERGVGHEHYCEWKGMSRTAAKVSVFNLSSPWQFSPLYYFITTATSSGDLELFLLMTDCSCVCDWKV